MPVFLAALLGGLIQVAGTLVGRVLLSLGFAYVVYNGLDTGLDFIKSQIASSASGLGSQALAAASTARVGSALNVVLSAMAARLLLNGMTGGAIRKLVIK
jgi:hypothetical protein